VARPLWVALENNTTNRGKKKEKKKEKKKGKGDDSHGKCLRDVSVSLFQTNKQGI
jgi:hypothetical protein